MAGNQQVSFFMTSFDILLAFSFMSNPNGSANVMKLNKKSSQVVGSMLLLLAS